MRIGLSIIRLLLAAVCLLTIGESRGQGLSPGEWRHYPAYAMPVKKLVETPRYLFTLASGSLFLYDKKQDERIALSPDNLLSGTNIDNIFHDGEKERLMVTYPSGRIDLLDCSGERISVKTLTDIADATIDGSRRINDVCFRGDTVIVAADFGLATFDWPQRRVVSSRRFDREVAGVARIGGRIVIACGSELLAAEASAGRLPGAGAFAVVADVGDRIEGVDALGQGILVRTERSLVLAEDDGSGGTRVRETDRFARGSVVERCRDGVLRYSADGQLREISENGGVRVIAEMPDLASESARTAFLWPEWIWISEKEGSAKIGLFAGEWRVLGEIPRPEGLTVGRVAYIIPGGERGERIYFVNLGPTNYRLGAGGTDAIGQPQAATVMDALTGEMTDAVAYPVKAAGSVAVAQQQKTGAYALASTRLAEDPEESGTYWLGTGNDGLLKITDGKLAGRYDSRNSPLPAAWGTRVFEIAADPEGNLWVTAQGTGENSGIAVLPAEKRRMDPATVKADDWIRVDIEGFTANKDMRMLICRRSNMIFMTDATPGVILVAIDTRGTYSDPTDDIVRVWTALTDQDGKTFAPGRHTSLAEDRDGRVWLGSNMGIIEIENPAEAVRGDLRVRRLKTARDDGSGLADYLCETDLVYDISVDHANRKWIATDGSGVYLVDGEGAGIVEHFTAANSPLPSNRVDAVYADGLTNRVYIATDAGLCAYGGDASPVSEDFDEVRIYPNPVRPDYAGPVTIEGLMEGSLVKIADAAGHVVWQGTANGGMARWDCRGAGGRRVASGVYFVMMSRSGEGVATWGAVGRIAVVN